MKQIGTAAVPAASAVETPAVRNEDPMPGDSEPARRLIVCADDFGRDVAINEAVEQAYQIGILTCASLMVAAPEAADAVARARRLPGLRVGLHVVLIDGEAMLPPGAIRGLVDADGRFTDSELGAGLRYFFGLGMRRRLAAEIRAQFEAFRATGLALDHVNAHRHLHLHPTVARLVVAIGRDYGMRAVRLPAEPVAVLRRAFPGEHYRTPLYGPAIAALRRRLARAGVLMNDHVFGIAWSGAMVEARLLGLLPLLPTGVNEIYCHPATRTTAALGAAMPGYRHTEELAAVTSSAVRRRIAELGVSLVAYSDLTPAPSSRHGWA